MFEDHDIALTNAQRNLNQRGVKKTYVYCSVVRNYLLVVVVVLESAIRSCSSDENRKNQYISDTGTAKKKQKKTNGLKGTWTQFNLKFKILFFQF